MIALLPPELRTRADITGSGELLWPHDAALEAVHAAAELGLAVLGGEVYEAIGDANGSFRDDWSARWRSGEPWDAFVARADELSRSVIADTGADEALRFFIAVCARDGYPRDLRIPDPEDRGEPC